MLKDSIYNNSIYKIHYLKNNETQSIYVFYGEIKKDANEKNLYDEKNLYKECFHPDELIQIEKNNTPVFFLSSQIHRDDTISNIKIKILKEVIKNTKNLHFSIPEIYLFCQKKEKFNHSEVYEILSHHKKIEITQNRLETFLLNIHGSETKTNPLFQFPENKEVFNYDDLLKLKLDGKKMEIDKILGQKYFFVNGEYPFVHNPFNVKENYDYLYEKSTRKSIAGLNQNLLFNTGNEITNNTIYLCLAKDVLKNAEQKSFSQEITCKIYFPILYSKKIQTFDDLMEKSQDLLEQDKKVLEHTNVEDFKTVDMFYNVYKERKTEISYLSRGIRSIKAIIHPEFSIKMPLDVIFKLVHATKNNPLIKYNPALRQEKLYRLYTDQISIDGQKIPFLNKATIIKLTKTIGKTKSVSVYLEKEKSYSFICEFLENGQIILFSEFEKPVPEDKIDEILKELINPLLDDIRDFLQQNGYQVSPFISLYDENIEIKYLNYELELEIENKLKLDKLACLSAIFIQEKENDKLTQMRFKRVANFNKTSSQEAFIIEKLNEGLNEKQIIHDLLENYSNDLNENQARELLVRVFGELEIEKGKKKTIIKNPGFNTIFALNQNTGILKISVENINDIEYLTTIPIFLDSILRITQDKNTTNYPKGLIDDLCHSRILKNKENKGEKKDKEIIIPELFINEEEDEDEDEEEKEEDDLKNDKKIQKIQNAMKLFFGNEDEDEDEDEEEAVEGGAGKKDTKQETYNGIDVPTEIELVNGKADDENQENSIKNIDGMKLNNPYFFQERISQRDPALILKTDTGKYKSYSRTCLSSEKRQPVILSDEELKKINDEHPGFLRKEDVISYGSDPNKKFNYICPRYWCLKTNTILDPKDFVKKMENGKEILVHPTCGKIITGNKVTPGHYVYEFYNTQDKKEGFKKYPGFQIDKHPDGFCLPCCFTSPQKSECKNNDEKEGKENEYIIGMEKFPLSMGRWGYLPISLQQFLKVGDQLCKSNSTKPCFLRHGVETNSKQSFIACIADAFYYGSYDKVPSIQEFKKTIVENLSLDYFINYQNGNLVNDFYDVKISSDKIDDFLMKSPISLKSKLYSLVYSSSPKKEAVLYYKKVINSFLNFIDFLNDDTIIIDHTYLWDMVTQPKTFLKNEKIPSKDIYNHGFNLVILEIPDNDITQNIEIICPSNHYTNELFNPKIGTLILMKKDEFYEPIYSYQKNEFISINRFFYADTKYDNIRNLLNEIIYPLMNTLCKPLPSLPNTYTFQPPIKLNDLENQLKMVRSPIEKYVFNFNNKIIGVLVHSNEKNRSIFVPCYPSSLNTLEKDKIIFMTDPEIWKSYEETVSFLLNLKQKSKNNIPCNPVINVVEDELIIGIITETNQFIQINPPIQKIDVPRDILLKKTIKDTNSILADVNTGNSREEDTERIEMIKRIRMEYNFYNVFRNTIRILLNDYENTKQREELEVIINKKFLLYETKLQKIQDLLKKLMNDKVLFIGDEKYYQLMSEVSTCIVKDMKRCKSSNVCAIVEKEGKSICQLILPRKNLINKKENEVIYYGRMADEFIRYTRIQNFMFQPQTYLSFGNNQVKYNLRENEIILIESMITQDYFEHLIPMNKNSYVKNNSYDEVEPKNHPLYENNVDGQSVKKISKLKNKILLDQLEPVEVEKVQEAQEPEKEPQKEPQEEQKEQEPLEDKINSSNKCKEKIEVPISDKKRNQLFPNNYKEFKYKNNNVACSYDVIVVLTKIYNKEKTIPQIKQDLIEVYQPYLLKFQTKIVDVLKIEGKEMLCDQVLQGLMTFENMIMNDGYFLSFLDLWVLIQKYEIPIIFMGTYKLLETNQTSKIMLGYKNLDSPDPKEYIFIVTQTITKKTPINKPPINRFILTETNKLLINIDDLNKETELYQELQKSIENPKSVEDFLTNFTKNLISL